MKYLVVVLSLVLTLSQVLKAAEPSNELVNTNVERTIELTSHLVHITSVISAENKGSSSIKSYNYVVEPQHAKNVAFVGAKVNFFSIIGLLLFTHTDHFRCSMFDFTSTKHKLRKFYSKLETIAYY